MGQSSDEPFHAEIAADLFSRREIEACVSRVGVQDRLQFEGFLRAVGWSSRSRLRALWETRRKACQPPFSRVVLTLHPSKPRGESGFDTRLVGSDATSPLNRGAFIGSRSQVFKKSSRR